MKPTAYKTIDRGGMECLWKSEPDMRGFTDKVKLIPLFTAHEIADFIRGLYFDDSFLISRIKNKDSIFNQIADKIEDEAK